MKHHFPKICYDADKLLDSCSKLSTFMRRLREQANSCPDAFDPDSYFGDGFEALVEVLINASPIDKRIYIRDYVPVTQNDMGVDGFGYGPKGEVHTVQVKARSNPEGVLTANRDHISNFVAHSQMKYKAEKMTIFTTAKTLHEVISNDMYMGFVRTIGYDDMRQLVDKNDNFWRIFRDNIKHFT